MPDAPPLEPLLRPRAAPAEGEAGVQGLGAVSVMAGSWVASEIRGKQGRSAAGFSRALTAPGDLAATGGSGALDRPGALAWLGPRGWLEAHGWPGARGWLTVLAWLGARGRLTMPSMLAALTVLAVLLSPGRTAGQALPEGVGPDPIVRALTFEGVSSVDEGELAAALETTATRCRSWGFALFCWLFDGGFFEERHRLNVDELPRDALRIRVFYWLRGYRSADASPEVLPTDGGVEVRFRVAEGPPTLVRSLEIVQDSALLSQDDIALARLPGEGEPADVIRIRTGAMILLEELRERGLADAEVRDTVLVDEGPAGDGGDAAAPWRNPPAEAGGAEHVGGVGAAAAAVDTVDARVRLTVEPGRPVTVGAVEVLGASEVSDRTIRRLTGIEVGQLYRRSTLEEAQRNLFRSGLFRRSVVQGTWEDAGPEPLPGVEAQATLTDSARMIAERVAATLPDTARPVIVSVIEAPKHELELGAGVSTVEFVQLQARHSRYDFLGSARRLDLSVAVGNLLAPELYGRWMFDAAVPEGLEGDPAPVFLDPTWNVSLGFTQPWLFSSRNELGLSVTASRRAVPGVVVDHTTGARIAVTRRIGRELDLTAGYRFEQTRVEAGEIYFCVNFGVCEIATIATLRASQRLSPVELSLIASRVEEPLNPVSGYRARLDVEHASDATASEYAYSRIAGEATRFQRLGRGVFATRLRIGWVGAGGGGDVLHPRKRFFSGGQRSVRGFAENQLGPRVLTVPASALLAEDGGPGEGEEPGAGEGEDGAEPVGCTVESLRDRSCDPSVAPLDAFFPRPLGGDAVLEGTIEYRFPIFGLGAALFLDGAWVSARPVDLPASARAAVTPGFGIRYTSPVGLIRVDLGIRPTLVEHLPVVTSLAGEDDLLTLATRRRWDPVGDSGGFFQQVFQRLVLHLSVGEAF